MFLMLLVGLSFFSVQAQMGQKKEEGANQAEFNADAQVRDGSAGINSRETEVDTTNSNTNLVGVAYDTAASSPSNSPGVETSTTSSSGSPGIRPDNGELTDGTNNKQSSSLNTAGSVVPRSQTKPTAQPTRTDKEAENKDSGKEEKGKSKKKKKN